MKENIFNLKNSEGNYRIFIDEKDGQIYRQYECDDELFDCMPIMVEPDEEITDEEFEILYGFCR